MPTTEIAVLTRVNSLLLAPHVALVEAGVPVSSTVSVDMLERTGVRAALAYLRLGATPHEMRPDDLQEVQRRPSRGFPPWISKWMTRPMSIDELRAIADRIDDVKVGTKVEGLADDLLVVADAVRRMTTREALGVIRDEIGLGRRDDVARRLEGRSERLAARRSRRAGAGGRPARRARDVRALAARDPRPARRTR